jgi:hypothetical protein
MTTPRKRKGPSPTKRLTELTRLRAHDLDIIHAMADGLREHEKRLTALEPDQEAHADAFAHIDLRLRALESPKPPTCSSDNKDSVPDPAPPVAERPVTTATVNDRAAHERQSTADMARYDRGERYCGTISPDGHHYGCTCAKGHEGCHVARTTGGTLCASWANGSAPSEPPKPVEPAPATAPVETGWIIYDSAPFRGLHWRGRGTWYRQRDEAERDPFTDRIEADFYCSKYKDTCKVVPATPPKPAEPTPAEPAAVTGEPTLTQLAAVYSGAGGYWLTADAKSVRALYRHGYARAIADAKRAVGACGKLDAQDWRLDKVLAAIDALTTKGPGR